MIATAVEQVSTANENELVSRAQQGDREAFAEIVRRNRAGMINVVYRMCGDAHLAEDAAQIAFMRAWQNLKSYKPRATLRSWLYRIAVNAALDMLRKEKPQAALEAAERGRAPSIVDEGLEKLVEEQELRQRVQQAVLALPEASRAVLVLREYEGLSYKEIAQSLDIPLGTVMSRLSYARKCLSEALSAYLLEEA